MKVIKFHDGAVIHGDCTTEEVIAKAKSIVGGQVPLITADPPYGKIVNEDWDKTDLTDNEFATWMLGWTSSWQELLLPNGAYYVWGGIGIPAVGKQPAFRPFLKYLTRVEDETTLKVANLITWRKKRAYGIQHNYLFTREECVYLFNGENVKKPRCFNVPLLDEKRGYAGYNPKYPAKSEYKRRTNVWTDITEIFRGKRHPTQKTQRLYEVMIEIHTKPGEWVMDPFGGAGTCAHAARKLKRQFLIVEKKTCHFDRIVEDLSDH